MLICIILFGSLPYIIMATNPFVQLFILHRMIFKNAGCKDASILFDGHLKKLNQLKAQTIMDDLYEYGILEYMKTKYNNTKLKLLSLAFKQMILKYPNDYSSIMSYQENAQLKQNPKRYYENEIFNQLYLIPLIFQYLDFVNVNQCCLVNSIWLYHGYSNNAIYAINMKKWLMRECKRKKFKFVNARNRAWKRWTNTKCLDWEHPQMP